MLVAITTLDGLVAALPGTPKSLHKSFTPQAAGGYMALFQQAGMPGAGATPSSGVAGDVPTDATAGAMGFTNPVAPALTYLAHLAAAASVQGVLFVYDRLWHNSGLSPTLLTAQTVNSVSLTRPNANGADAEAWFQVYTTLGAGSTAPTISYTDQDGNDTQTGTLQGFVTAAAAGRTFPFSLASGDTGVRSIQTYTNGATMTSGTFGLVIRRRLATIPIGVSNTGDVFDFAKVGNRQISDDTCLEFVWLANAASATQLLGSLTLAQG